jgi:hypothetical protein
MEHKSREDMIAEYMKARVGKTPYEGPTKAPADVKEKKREIKGQEKSAEEMSKCKQCGMFKCPKGKECCKDCEGMMKESAYLYRKAVDIIKSAMTPPPAAPAPAQAAPAAPPPQPAPQAPQGGGAGAPPGLLPLPVLLQQLQYYQMMQQGGAPEGPPAGA